MLFESISNEPDKFKTSATIRAMQQQVGIPGQSVGWTHAAIYIDGVRICESNFDPQTGQSGVRLVDWWEYIGSHRIRIRRLPGIRIEDRWKIAANALAQLPSGYDYMVGLEHFLRTRGLPIEQWLAQWIVRLIFWRDRRKAVEPKSVELTVCSELCVRAYARAGFVIWNSAARIAFPGDLDCSSSLIDVPVNWQRIPPPMPARLPA